MGERGILRGNYYRARNVAGQDITLVVQGRNNLYTEVVVPDGETLDGLNEHAMNFLWRYKWMGLITVEIDYGDGFKPDWRTEGF